MIEYRGFLLSENVGGEWDVMERWANGTNFEKLHCAKTKADAQDYVDEELRVDE